MNQLAMAGDDWKSDRQRSSEARALANVHRAALKTAVALERASDAVNEFLSACNEAGDGLEGRGEDDGRVLLIGNMMEYANFLKARWSKR